MDIMETIKARRSVRTYNEKKIDAETAKQLQAVIDECNKESGLNIQLFIDEPQGFSGMMARFGKFTNVRNYIAMVGKKSNNLEETVGYYGEKIVLKATELGLGSCWVAMTFNKGKTKSKCKIGKGEVLEIVISLGYSDTVKIPRKTKTIEELSSVSGEMPEWFSRGMEAAQYAPTAMNQQKFMLTLDNNKVLAKAGKGFYTMLDLGIVKYHFESAAQKSDLVWETV